MASKKSSPSIATLGCWSIVLGGGAFLIWSVVLGATDEMSVVEGRTYEFTLLAHPYGDAAEWWQAVRDALAESDASLVTKIQDGPNDVRIRFTKSSPVTAKLPPHTVLYPSTPQLATATLLGARPVSTPVAISGTPKSKHPKAGIDRAARYEAMAAECEADAKKPHLSSEQALNLELAKEYRARARRHRAGGNS